MKTQSKSSSKTTILVLCTGNSCRSQMAEGFLKHYGKDKVIVHSAGIETHGLNPRAVQVMEEINISIYGQSSDAIEKYLDQQYDFVITVCDNASEQCPIFPGATTVIHQNFPDPAGSIGPPQKVLAEFRHVRDLIDSFCENFIKNNIPKNKSKTIDCQ